MTQTLTVDSDGFLPCAICNLTMTGILKKSALHPEGAPRVVCKECTECLD